MKSRLLPICAIIASYAQTARGAREVVGEQARYKVVQDMSRTTPMIRRGVMDTLVTSRHNDPVQGDSYRVHITYDLHMNPPGRRKGERDLDVPATYFSPTFLSTLRRDGLYESARFKIKYLGTASTTTSDGNHYVDCDRLFFYDINARLTLNPVTLEETLRRIANPFFVRETIEHLELDALVKEGLPVLGAVKLDVSGVLSGVAVKAGADLIRATNVD